jgi:uncharacterized protein YyaL (SSP411 family)
MRTNRLIHEKSPYLLQHAHNPVDWFPWGPEAFEKARAEDKPVFLSIGYSTCHWCHVMERESFEDPEVAKLLNETFVCLKVDREERPDVDDLYMSACQMMSGSGGWPLTIILTPDKRPFFAGTYFPKEGRFGRPGLLDLIPRLHELWVNRRSDVLHSAEQITGNLGASVSRMAPAPSDTLDIFTLETAYRELSASFDQDHGGFGVAPKFPSPHNFTFLLRQWQRSGDPHALHMVEKSLQSMRLGGLWDHLGYGFHRYSTDEFWLVPHFEKMLYDQALLAIAYLETFQATHEETYRATALEIFAYVRGELTDSEGGFYCGEDADSEGIEGKFYLWTVAEIGKILGPQTANVFCHAYGVEPDGNFHDESTGQNSGANILHLIKPLHELAAELQRTQDDLAQELSDARFKLFKARQQRVRPARDDKILTDWNGLMIAALAYGARVLESPLLAQAASRAADFILKYLRRSDGRLLHRWRDGEAAIPALLDDYAFLIWGLLELYETEFQVERLEQAREMTGQMLEHFWDEEGGGFFLVGDDALDLPVRRKDIYDGALPSGNSVAALDLLRVGRITSNADLEAKAHRLFSTFAATISRYPAGYAQLLNGLDFALGPSSDITVAGKAGSPSLQTMIRVIQARFLPRKVLLVRHDGATAQRLAKIASHTKEQVSIGDRATAYVCRDRACLRPITELHELEFALNEPENLQTPG